MALITAQHLNISRQGKDILKDVSLSVTAHDFITIIGPNGAGKSMLLKCLMGVIAPDSGQITRQAGLTIGYVPQHFSADRALPVSVRRFLTLGRKRGTSAELESICHDTAIAHLLDHPLYVLSGGERQRVLLARALLGSPNLLILDEPAQNLDISGQLGFYKLLEQVYAARKLSILMVSHDLHLVMASTKQVICLFKHICCHGEPQTVTRDPEFIALFGDDMARMMAVYHHEHDHVHGAPAGHVHSERCNHD